MTGSSIANPRAFSIFEIVSIDKFSVPFNTREIYCCEQPILSAKDFCVNPNSCQASSSQYAENNEAMTC